MTRPVPRVDLRELRRLALIVAFRNKARAWFRLPFFLRHGRYQIDAPCPGCGALDGWQCYPGDIPKCWRCGVKVLRFGITPAARCVTPNGRIDSHMSYVRGDVCAFCGKGEATP